MEFIKRETSKNVVSLLSVSWTSCHNFYRWLNCSCVPISCGSLSLNLKQMSWSILNMQLSSPLRACSAGAAAALNCWQTIYHTRRSEMHRLQCVSAYDVWRGWRTVWIWRCSLHIWRFSATNASSYGWWVWLSAWNSYRTGHTWNVSLRATQGDACRIDKVSLVSCRDSRCRELLHADERLWNVAWTWCLSEEFACKCGNRIGHICFFSLSFEEIARGCCWEFQFPNRRLLMHRWSRLWEFLRRWSSCRFADLVLVGWRHYCFHVELIRL